MKLNRTTLKKLIREVRRKESMILAESLSATYDGLMKQLDGEDVGVNTIGVMSGQYPMAKSNLSPEEEDERAMQLNARLAELGMNSVKIDGNYENIPEKSNVIKNPSMEDMERLCVEFEQQSFVWGQRDGGVLVYELRVVNHESGGSSMYPGSKKTSKVMRHEELEGAATNYSELNGLRFAFELF